MNSRERGSASLTRRQWCAAIGGLCLAGRTAASPSRPVQPVLAQDWVPGTDPAGWLVSEKFDGVRALWDGERLRFRSGRAITAPAWFLAHLPQLPLDGELWLARSRFDDLSGIVRSKVPDDAAWRQISYQVFELPGAGGTFRDRAARLAQRVSAHGWPPLQAVAQTPVADAAALQRRLDAVIAAGGEGLVLHQGLAPEVSGRTPLLRKLKPLQDAEAVVIGHLPGRGRFAGHTGALQVQAADGRRFQIGTGLSEAQRAEPPAVGSRIAYTYQGLTGQGLPRFASYWRVAPVF
jgi:DNA ligase 1